MLANVDHMRTASEVGGIPKRDMVKDCKGGHFAIKVVIL